MLSDSWRCKPKCWTQLFQKCFPASWAWLLMLLMWMIILLVLYSEVTGEIRRPVSAEYKISHSDLSPWIIVWSFWKVEGNKRLESNRKFLAKKSVKKTWSGNQIDDICTYQLQVVLIQVYSEWADKCWWLHWTSESSGYRWGFPIRSVLYDIRRKRERWATKLFLTLSELLLLSIVSLS